MIPFSFDIVGMFYLLSWSMIEHISIARTARWWRNRDKTKPKSHQFIQTILSARYFRFKVLGGLFFIAVINSYSVFVSYPNAMRGDIWPLYAVPIALLVDTIPASLLALAFSVIAITSTEDSP